MKPHLDVARALSPLVTTKTGRDWLDSVGFTSESAMICCAEGDLLRDVFSRARRGRPPALVAFLRGERLSVIIVTPAVDEQAGSGQAVHERITIGMLWDAAKATGETVFRVSEWDAPQVASVPEKPSMALTR